MGTFGCCEMESGGRALHLDRPVLHSAQRQVAGRADGFDARKRAHLLLDLARRRPTALPDFEYLPGERHGQHASPTFFPSKPGSTRCRSQRLRMRRPAPIRRTSERATSDTTRMLRVLFPPRVGVRPPEALLEGFGEVGRRPSPRRRETGEDAGQHRHDEGEGENGRAQSDRSVVRQLVRQEGDDRVHPEARDEESERAAHERQEEGLGDELAEQPAAARPQSAPESDLLAGAPACGRA